MFYDDAGTICQCDSSGSILERIRFDGRTSACRAAPKPEWCHIPELPDS